MKTVITIIGLPGSGKTTLGDMIHKLIKGSRLNADQIRATVSCDLQFAEEDRELQAYRLGAIAALSLYEPPQIVSGKDGYSPGHLNQTSIVDFVCPTERTRSTYDWALRVGNPAPLRKYDIWMNTIRPADSRFPDTAKMFQPPKGCTLQVDGYKSAETLAQIALMVATEVRPDLF